jgi:allantoicase
MQRPTELAVSAPEWVNLPQLNAGRAGTKVLFATDEWFAEAGNLNREEPPVFDENAFDTHGKVLLSRSPRG